MIKQHAAKETKMRSVDTAVQGTNDDSILSKRSAARLGYFRDPFVRVFIKNNPPRRSPMLNRAYFLRMEIMERVLTAFLGSFQEAQQQQQQQRQEQQRDVCKSTSSNNSSRIQVLSLGAGFDTFACRHYQQQKQWHFFEVDFATVMNNKVALIEQHNNNNHQRITAQQQQHCYQPDAALPIPFEPNQEPKSSDKKQQPQQHDSSSSLVLYSSPRYACIGCDLRDTTSLHQLLSSRGFDFAAPTAVYAECVTQYMEPEVSTALLAWVASSLTNAVYVGYDQIASSSSSAAGEQGQLDEDWFGRKMLSSLKARSSPLLGTAKFSNCMELALRAESSVVGFKNVRCVDFTAVSRFVLGERDLLRRIKDLEPFDEHEEWAFKCRHYALLLGVTPRAEPWFVNAVEQIVEQKHKLLWATNEHQAREQQNVKSNGNSNGKQLQQLLTARVLALPSARSMLDGVGNAVASMSVSQTTVIFSFGGTMQHQQKQDNKTPLLAFSVSSNSSSNNNDEHVHQMQIKSLTASMSPTSRSCATLTRVAVPASSSSSCSSSSAALAAFVLSCGRRSPTAPVPSDDAHWLLLVHEIDISRSNNNNAVVVVSWTRLSRIDDCDCEPSPRFRHVAAASSASSFVICCGSDGKQDGIGDAWRGEIVETGNHSSGSSKLGLRWTLLSGNLPRVASPQLVDVGDGDRFLLFGGLELETNEISGAAHVLEVSANDNNNNAAAAAVRQVRVADDSGVNLARFSAVTASLLSSSTSSSSFLLLGGVGRSKDDINNNVVQVLSLGENDVLESTGLIIPPQTLLPAFETIRSHIVRLHKTSTFLIFGGGYGCLGFGAFLAKPRILTIGGGQQQQKQSKPSFSSRLFRLPPIPSIDQRFIITTNNSDELTAASLRQQQRQGHPLLFRSEGKDKPALFDTTRWSDPQHIINSPDGDRTVSVHVCRSPSRCLDFVDKNFTFRHVKLRELIEHCCCQTSAPETWYLRAVSERMKTERTDFWAQFPSLGRELVLPAAFKEFLNIDNNINNKLLHQSVFRVNQYGMKLHTHYDVLDNFLLHCAGPKRVPPSMRNALYVEGSSSPIVTSDLDNDTQIMLRYPRFLEARLAAFDVTLQPGDILFIPALWFHRVEVGDDRENERRKKQQKQNPYSISVNLFFQRPDLNRHYDKEDLYGNKDLPSQVAARRAAVQSVRETVDRLVAPGVEEDGDDFRRFTIQQIIGDLKKEN